MAEVEESPGDTYEEIKNLDDVVAILRWFADLLEMDAPRYLPLVGARLVRLIWFLSRMDLER